MNYARIYSWNPFRPNQFAYDGEGTATPSAPPPGGAPAGDSVPPVQGDGVTSPGSDSSAGATTPSPNTFESAFSGFDDDLDSIELPGEEPTTPAEGGAVATPGAEPPKPSVAPVAPQTPTAAPVAPQPQADPAVPQAPSAPMSKREELDEAITGFKTNFDDLTKWATTEMFSLTPAELEALDTDARSVIPALMAKTYTRGLLATTNFIKQFVPEMIAQEYSRLNAATKRSSEAEDAFYKAWPALNPKDHGDAMKQWAQLYRQQNPKATRQQAIDFVGRALMTQFGVTAAPAQTPPKAVPFQPARPGGHVPNPPPPKTNPWDGLDHDFDVE